MSYATDCPNRGPKRVRFSNPGAGGFRDGGGSISQREPGVQGGREPLVFPAVTRRCCRGSSEEKKVEDEGAQPHGWSLEVGCPFAQHLPAMQFGEGSPHGVQDVWLVQEPRRNRSLIAAFSLSVRFEARSLSPSSCVIDTSPEMT
jgi:hypothetical protein